MNTSEDPCAEIKKTFTCPPKHTARFGGRKLSNETQCVPRCEKDPEGPYIPGLIFTSVSCLCLVYCIVAMMMKLSAGNTSRAIGVVSSSSSMVVFVLCMLYITTILSVVGIGRGFGVKDIGLGDFVKLFFMFPLFLLGPDFV